MSIRLRMSESGHTGSDGAGRGDGPAAAPGKPPVPREDLPFARRVVIAVGIALLMLGLAIFLRKSVYVLMLAFAAVLIAVMLRGMAAWLAGKTRLPTGAALATVVIGLVGLFILLGVLLAPSVVAQFEQLADRLPQSVERSQERLRQYTWGRKVLGEGAAQAPQTQQDQLGGASGATAADAPTTQPQPGETVISKAVEATTRPATVSRVVNYGGMLLEGLFTFLLVIIVGIYLAAQPGFYVEGFLKLFPAAERPRLRDVLYEVGRTLLWWMIAQLIPMLAIGVLVGGGLWLIGVPLWLPLGILAALLNFIPNFGPIIAAVPAILIALADSPEKALWVVGLSVLSQNLEGYVITPLVQRRAVRMPPALTILSQVLLGLLLGPLGVILAAPMTAAALVVIKMLYVEDTLGTTVEHAEEKEH
jgi:predicted PurR-regulated permease PerM